MPRTRIVMYAVKHMLVLLTNKSIAIYKGSVTNFAFMTDNHEQSVWRQYAYTLW